MKKYITIGGDKGYTTHVVKIEFLADPIETARNGTRIIATFNSWLAAFKYCELLNRVQEQ